MFLSRYVLQPAVRYLSLMEFAIDQAQFTHLDVAVAYATTGGVMALQEAMEAVDSVRWMRLRKRWLVGIDWCRTDPAALARLEALPRSAVRIPAGGATIRRPGCVPRLPFHPKVFILRAAGSLAVVSGSGNLSRNGMTKGHECGNVAIFKQPLTPAEQRIHEEAKRVTKWFSESWRNSNPLAEIKTPYEAIHASAQNMRAPTPTEDDALNTAERPSPKLATRLAQLRAASHLWIEAGNLHRNRGPNLPGSQLMMSPMTRVFFGFSAEDKPRNSQIGPVALNLLGQTDIETLRFGNNSMDILNLPLERGGKPMQYDQETLLFRKTAQGFNLTIGTPDRVREWLRLSRSIGALYQMTQGRKWGVF